MAAFDMFASLRIAALLDSPSLSVYCPPLLADDLGQFVAMLFSNEHSMYDK